MTECKSCKTELTEMKDGEGNVTCLRCLVCHPLTKYVAPEKKPDKYVDKPWTEERVTEIVERVAPGIVRNILENFHIAKPENKETSWREQAKVLGIEVYDKINKKPRLKVDILDDIKERTTVESSD